MRCYDCAMDGKAEEAVGVCGTCGRATCLEHGALHRVPQYRRSTAGIGGPMVRLPRDRMHWLCNDCNAAARETAASA